MEVTLYVDTFTKGKKMYELTAYRNWKKCNKHFPRNANFANKLKEMIALSQCFKIISCAIVSNLC